MSKVKLSNIYPDITPGCDKCDNNNAALTHICWLCPQLHKFWEDVFKIISNILGQDLEPDPLIALLGVPERNDLNLTPAER